MTKKYFFHFYSLHFKHFVKTTPLFHILLPVFFILHGCISNYGVIPVPSALLLALLYIGIALTIAGVGWLFYRDIAKACLITFCLLTWHFLFGKIQDTLTELSPGGFISQYRFILPVSFFLFLIIVTWLKKREKTLLALIFYLNILLMVLIVMDAGWLITKFAGTEKNATLNPDTADYKICDTCRKPDIFLIVLDQYAGSRALKEVFHFDNTAFENELSQRSFHVVNNSHSNYNLTPFSMASTLNMDYLAPEMGVKKNLKVGYSYKLIRNSLVLQFLEQHGYVFSNYSVFDFPGQPAHKYGAFLPYGTKLITSQTFIGRISRDIRSAILEGKLPFKSVQKKIAYGHLQFNDDIFELTKNIASNRTNRPKFVYAHFMMPHFPYYFDSKGNPLPLEKLLAIRNTNAGDYIEYLQYCNRKVLQLADDILAHSANPPVIMLLSDHGFRHPGKNAARDYDFMNLNAVYLPGKDYGLFHDSLTNVNHFRVFFNSCFNQRLPLLKDSTIDLWD
jgi:hypothetical protein